MFENCTGMALTFAWIGIFLVYLGIGLFVAWIISRIFEIDITDLWVFGIVFWPLFVAMGIIYWLWLVIYTPFVVLDTRKRLKSLEQKVKTRKRRR